jgi:hypothetical protein
MACHQNGVRSLHEFGSCVRGTFAETEYRVELLYFHFSSFVGVFLDDVVNLWAKEFWTHVT